MKEIKKLENGSHDMKGNLYFDTEDGEIKIRAVDALEIAYGLFDWAGFDYRILDELNEKVDDEND